MDFLRLKGIGSVWISLEAIENGFILYDLIQP